MISKIDFVGVPSTDSERTRAFYVETLGLRPDDPDGNDLMLHHRYAPYE
ncbi:MAG: hypothetical protein QOI84_1455 [Solirubrobacterales bacterium]|jgi:catechol 2,3-dioxygenase-like lactoylglutathione lyase family enzyme|nr:hypothetical protein [Solirubrobacterales bacterium]